MDKRVQFLKNYILSKIELLRSDIGEIRYKEYVAEIEAINDLEVLKDLDGLNLQVEYAEYIRENIQNYLKEFKGSNVSLGSDAEMETEDLEVEELDLSNEERQAEAMELCEAIASAESFTYGDNTIEYDDSDDEDDDINKKNQNNNMFKFKNIT